MSHGVDQDPRNANRRGSQGPGSRMKPGAHAKRSDEDPLDSATLDSEETREC